MSRFMDPTTDFGFKKLFGEEDNKDITIDFLNALLELETPLLDLSFPKTEQLPQASDQRTGVFDLLCRDAGGNRYLVEMQKSLLAFIKDRMVYYSTFPIAAQAPKGPKRYQYSPPPTSTLRIHDAMVAYGYETEEETEDWIAAAEWNYELKAVYCVAILAYKLKGSTSAVARGSLRNDQPPHLPFYNKLQFITIELPLFDPRQPEYSLDRRLNKWLYFLKYLPAFDRIPDIFKNDKIFQKAFWIAAFANFTPEEREQYDLILKRHWDTYAALQSSHDEGWAEGQAAGMAEGQAEGKAEGIAIGQAEGVAKGKTEGKLEQGQDMLQLLFTQKLGPIPEDIAAAIRTINSLEQINAVLAHFIKINDWETLRQYLVAPK
ncbi:MAG: PD-(D/E)XK nuclease family transposase [bacterium]